MRIKCTKIFTGFRIRYKFYNFRPMQKRLRDVPLDKPSVIESKTILNSYTSFFFSDDAKFHLSGHVNKHNTRFGFRRSLINISIAHLVWKN